MSVVRSPRNTDIISVTTPSNVGPGSYYHGDYPNAPSYAAFSSTQKRDLNANKSTSAVTPGPGAYRNTENEMQKKPMNCFTSKINRFAPSEPGSSIFKSSTIRDNPGPGTYKTALPWSSKKNTHNSPRSHSPIVQAKASVPAIPRLQQAHGYEETDSGDLVLQSGEAHFSGIGNDTVGPAMYNPQLDSVRPFRGFTNFGRSSSARRTFEPSISIENPYPSRDNPGPGYYEPDPTKQVEPEKKIVFSNRKKSFKKNKTHYGFSSTPMGYQIPPKSTISPGPGAYTGEIMSTKDPYSSVVELGGVVVQRFGSTVSREGWDRPVDLPYSRQFCHSTPGPGTYNPVIGSKAHKSSEEYVPFNSTTERDCLKKISREETVSPGPGEYLGIDGQNQITNGCAQVKNKLKKQRSSGNKPIVFGSVAPRFFGSQFERKPTPTEEYYLAGIRQSELNAPQTAPMKNESTENRSDIRTHSAHGPAGFRLPKKNIGSSSFASTSKRFTKASPSCPHHFIVGDTEIPPVGTYEIQPTRPTRPQVTPSSKCKDNLSNPMDLHSMNASAPMPPSTFSSSQRSSYVSREVASVPGPGSYDLLGQVSIAGKIKKAIKPVSNVQLAFSSDQQRFKSDVNSYVGLHCTSEELGPGAYSMPNSFVKKTFNVSMLQ